MNDVTLRFLEVYNKLVNEKIISNASSFAKQIGITPSLFNEISKGRNNVGVAALQNTVIKFPQIDSKWLLTGEIENNNVVEEPISQYTNKGKPFYNLPVSAGKSSYYNNGAIQPDGYIKDIPGISETDAFLPVHGYSMQPEVKEGSIIGVKKIDHWDTLNTQRKYLIITQDDRMIKYIQPDETNPEIIWCISPNYPKFKIYKSQIIEIHRVTFVINAE